MTFAALSAALKDNLKWIVASLTGASALIFSGLSVASVNLLTGRDLWWVPIALSALAVLAAGGAVALAGWTMSAVNPTMSDLFPDDAGNQSLRGQVEALRPAAVEVHGGLDALGKAMNEAGARIKRLEGLQDGSRGSREELGTAREALRALQLDAREALDCAAYVQLLGRYRHALMGLTASAVVVVSAAIGSGWATGAILQQDRAEPALGVVDFTQPVSVRVYFVDSESRASALDGRSCPNGGAPFPATAIGGDAEQPILLMGPLRGSKSTDCQAPWIWHPAKNDVALAFQEGP